MKSILSVTLILAVLIYGCFAPPVTKNKQEKGDGPQQDGLEDYMEYHRYLREVVTALESDPEFRKKLEKADETDIRSGKIANELEFVSHKIRNRLDEIKRTELVRLRELTRKKKELMENNSIDDPVHHHLDNTNVHTFEIDDLKKLIAQTTRDLAEADHKRREEFKQYELQKEYERQQQLNHTAGEERIKLEHELQKMEEKHKEHEKLHEPGHKQQLEEVWEEQDQMQQDFDPKTFFMLHDLDSNGLWDETEVKALFIKELDKMYAAGAPEDDMRERAEEMERMRESVFAEVDTNKDGFIDYDEFVAQTRRNDFQQDKGWKGLDEQQPPFTDEELREYIKLHEAQQLPQMPPPGVAYYPPGGYQVPPAGYHPNDIYGNPHAPAYPPQAQLQPGQLPQAQVNPQQVYHQKVPPQGNPQFTGGNRGVPNLNTNEVYPNQLQQNANQQQNQPNQQYNPPNQQYNPPNQQYNQPPIPNVQQSQPSLQQKPQQNQLNYQQNESVEQKILQNPNERQNNLPPAQNPSNQVDQPSVNHQQPSDNLPPNNLNRGQGVPQVQKL